METRSSSLDTPSPGSSEPALKVSLVKLSREEEAKQVLEHTLVKPQVSWGLILSFLLTIFSVPTVQFIAQARQHKAVLPELNRGEQIVPQAEELKQFEGDLEAQSVVAGWVMPPTQSVLTRLGVGNEKAYVGRDGWLAYRPDLEYVSNSGFLDAAGSSSIKPGTGQGSSEGPSDPVAAIVRFKEQLAERGITLVLLPTPLKPMLEAPHFSARQTAFSQPLQNPSYPDFLRQMEKQKVLVYDPTETLFRAQEQGGNAQFLRTDTHWTPEAMQITATGLAAFIEQHVSLPQVTTDYGRRTVAWSGKGDIAQMLKLPAGEMTYPPQKVSLEQVVTREGQVWRPSPASDVLLLGDSFTNIYSRGDMGWGNGAGLAEQLSFNLRRPLDVLAINAGGSYSIRRRLRDRLLHGHDQLAGKRVVVWQFAMRDLQSGNWKQVDLPVARNGEVGRGTTTASRSPLLGVNTSATPVLRPAKPAVVARFRSALAGKAATVEVGRSPVLHGANGWLFYLPDIYYLSSSGFLQSRRNPQIDALVNFKNQLARRGIKLLVMPAPAKSTIYSEKLGLSGIEVPQAPQNPSFSSFRQALQAQGITFFDPTETLLQQKRATSAPLFLPTDSHWSFVAMENTAAQLAARLQTQLSAVPPVSYTRRPAPVRNITDISMMLKRQPGNKQFVRVRQTIQQVFTPAGTVWKASPNADILVMGDSFVNMYSHGGYWGKGAGFAEQLSYYLQRPIDLIAMDRGGVNKTRRALQLDMRQGRDRLAGKKLVIYEVASRYLMDRNWEKIQLPTVKPKPQVTATRPTSTPTPDPLAGNLVRATVAARSDVPAAGTTPYPDLVMTLRLTNVQPVQPRQPKTRPGRDILVYTWGLRNATRTAAAGWKVGQTVTLQLKPWRAVEDEYGSYDRTDLEGGSGAQLNAYWAPQ